jgi:hypothetical protein
MRDQLLGKYIPQQKYKSVYEEGEKKMMGEIQIFGIMQYDQGQESATEKIEDVDQYDS